MNYIKQQLRAYYREQGIGKRRVEKLVKSDVASLYRSAKRVHGEYFPFRPAAMHSLELDGIIWWRLTPEGDKYWRERSRAL